MDESHVPGLHASEDYGNAESKSSEALDRLSELPNALILLILSMLPMTDVVGTTLLSKRWKDVWTTVPCLHFQDHDNCTNPDKFRDFVCGALALWKGSKILKFTLTCNFAIGFVERHHHTVDSWLLFAIEKQVEEVHIDVGGNYYLPPCLRVCSSIKKLSLVSCILEDNENVQWDHLESLTVKLVRELSENTLNKLISGAPRLEILNLHEVAFVDNLNIRSTSLKVMVLNQIYPLPIPVLTIWAPNLESLQIAAVSFHRCLLNVPSLTQAALNFVEPDCFSLRIVNGCFVHFVDPGCSSLEEIMREVFLNIRHVQKLTLSDSCVKGLCEMKKKDMVLPLSNAKYLKLVASEAHQIIDVVEMFPQLRMLAVEPKDVMILHYIRGVNDKVFFNNSSAYNTLESRLDSPCSILMHLRTVEVTWFLHDTSIYLVIEILLKNGGMLEKMVFRPISYDILKTKHQADILKTKYQAEKKVMSMQRSSPTAEVNILLDW